jgi:ribonuclease BN (tRNA processing enzyme)
MSEFEVFVLGVGDAFSELFHPSALLLSCDGFKLAIDCPDMYRGILRATAARSGRALSLADIDTFLITHVHGDHMNGLEGVAFFKRFVEQKKLELVCSKEVRETIWEPRLHASMGALWDGQGYRQMQFDDYFNHREQPWESAIQIGPFNVRSRRTIHHVPTSALLIEAAGRTLGYSCDTAFDPGLIDFLSPADLIIHETNFGAGHTAYESLAALPAELRQKMRLIHYSDIFDLQSSNITPLREGEVLVP